MTVSTSSANEFLLGGETPVNRLGYGAMWLTGPGMWGPPERPEEAIAVLRRAVELGVTFIDTADSYGPGYNEEIIRAALHPYPEDLIIATKGGMLRSGPTDWQHGEGTTPYIVACGRPEYLRQQVEVSLLRLGVEQIGMYQLHRIDSTVPLEDQLGALTDMQAEGKIRHIGLSGQPEITIEQLTAARAITEIVAVENLYNVADRAGEKVLRHVEEEGIAFIPWFPLGHGDLVGSGSRLAEVAADFGATAAQLALAWLLRQSPNTILIPGTTSIAHLEQNMAARDVRLTDDQWREVEEAAARMKPWRPA
ncbi:aldo/keto reductase [Actinoallomurus spadix]|uniref:Aldo/keto reductase n=1 Tax=Actinoallomurus spadix TaxID=79912 RepID=A0ABN0X941_9ACTN|nr:aldo/keto reductase [Actinoallomurus spadix]MCO5987972.1 aldo/keto reductase [Actinoallomurus spadix]